MVWEASQTRSARHMHLAQLVLVHRLLPQDPLLGEIDEPAWLPGLLEPEAHAPASDADLASVNLL